MNTPYRFDPHRALPPIILASPNAYALFSGEIHRTEIALVNDPKGFQRLIEDLTDAYFPVIKYKSYLHTTGRFGGSCFVSTIWSDNPSRPDVLIVQSRDKFQYSEVINEYINTLDFSVLQNFKTLKFI